MNCFQTGKFQLPYTSNSNISTQGSKIHQNQSWMHLIHEPSVLDVKQVRFKSYDSTPAADQARTRCQTLHENPAELQDFSWENQQFQRYFKTTAYTRMNQRQFLYDKQRQRVMKTEESQSVPWKCIRQRVPSYSFNGSDRRTIFQIKDESTNENRFNNFFLNFQATQKKQIPLDKQTNRKQWMYIKMGPDKIYDMAFEQQIKLKYDQGVNKCLVDIERQIRPQTAKPAHTYNINMQKVLLAEKQLRFQKNGYQEFGKNIGRNTLSPFQQKVMKNNEKIMMKDP